MLIGPFEDYDYEEPFERTMSRLRSASRKGAPADKAYACLLHLIRSIFAGEVALEIQDPVKPDRWLVYDCGCELWVFAASRDLVVFLDVIPCMDPVKEIV